MLTTMGRLDATQMGYDPVLIATVAKAGLDVLGSVFGNKGPSAAEIAAYQAEVARREAAQRQQTLLIGGGIAVAGIVTLMLISRRAS